MSLSALLLSVAMLLTSLALFRLANIVLTHQIPFMSVAQESSAIICTVIPAVSPLGATPGVVVGYLVAKWRGDAIGSATGAAIGFVFSCIWVALVFYGLAYRV